MSFEEAISYALAGLPGSAPVVEPDRLDAGSGLAGYQLEAVVGRGGMGVVWRARQVSLDRPVAIKVIAPEQAGSAAFRERFLREAKLAASLEHAHVLPSTRPARATVDCSWPCVTSTARISRR